MAGRARRNHGGSVRKLPSGRFQVRVRDQVTNKLVTLGTHPTKADADAALRAARRLPPWIYGQGGAEVCLGEWANELLAAVDALHGPRGLYVINMAIRATWGTGSASTAPPSCSSGWISEAMA